MSLIGTDQRTVFVKRIALFFVQPNNFLQQFHIQMMLSGSVDPIYQLLNIGPSVFVQSDANRLGLMSKNQG